MVGSNQKQSCFYTASMNRSDDRPGFNGNDPLFSPLRSIDASMNLVSSAAASLLLFPAPTANDTDVVRFSYNQAGESGGAIYFSSNNRYDFVMPGTVFEFNSANILGGAIGFGINNYFIYMSSAIFNNNYAVVSGGGIFFSQLNSLVRFEY